MQTDTSANPTLDEVHDDIFLLDSSDFVIPESVHLISNVIFSNDNEVQVKNSAPGGLARLFQRFPLIIALIHSFRLFFAADKNTVIMIDGSHPWVWLFTGYLNRLFFFRKRTMFLWDSFLEYKLGTEKRLWFFPFIKIKTAWKESLARGALLGYDMITVWSRKQVSAHAEYFRLPKEKLIYLPFKSNHSNRKRFPEVLCNIPLGKFVFSGGNGKRDYKCLVDAVRGTDVAVVISSTDPKVRKEIEFLPNVILLGAPEPAFAQLQVICYFAVVPMIHSGLKGGGETNICNAMGHEKPVIACCNIAAEDYIVEGETGFVVPVGNSELLRQRILELWNNPDLVEQMGRNAKQRVEEYFTHDKFVRRLLRLAILLGDSRRS